MDLKEHLTNLILICYYVMLGIGFIVYNLIRYGMYSLPKLIMNERINSMETWIEKENNMKTKVVIWKTGD